MNIAVALGSGGAKGLAHIGVLDVLHREGYTIGGIAGTSIGGVIAAGFAAGYSPQELAEMAARNPIGQLLTVRPAGGGLIGLDRIAEMLHQMLGDRTFADLPIPLAVSAVDLSSGCEMTLREGRVVDAVLATIALPGIFPPQVIGEHRLVDGGALDPVPVRPARELCPAPVVAVVLVPPADGRNYLERASLFRGIPAFEVVERLRTGQAFRVFLGTLELSIAHLVDLRLQIDRPEVIVRPKVHQIGLFEQPDLTMMIDRGVRAMEAALPQLEAQFRFSRRVGRWIGRLGR
jgi:NTE family protein